MSEICPLVFEPIFRPKVWGGRNLARIFSKSLPESGAIGESWECADLENGQSVVARGPAKGMTLHALVDEWGEGLIGGVKLNDGRFPLLIKFLDAVENLSIQVHPIELAALPRVVLHKSSTKRGILLKQPRRIHLSRPSSRVQHRRAANRRALAASRHTRLSYQDSGQSRTDVLSTQWNTTRARRRHRGGGNSNAVRCNLSAV
ncbi:MAG: hypothetical protein IPK83_05675 [Planctomycetes bacterium]|nr:hypothetical protein [Planctomycetota bacterium]